MSIYSEKYATPALHLVKSDAAGGFSKIGGLPNLPADVAWPTWQGKSLTFLCQIAVDQFPADFSDPAGGYWYFFYSAEQPWGFDPDDRGGWKIIHSKQKPPSEVRSAPDDLDEYDIFNEKWIAFRQIASLPSADRLLEAGEILDDEQCEAYEEQQSAVYCKQPAHQLFGYPLVIQGDGMELECQLAAEGINCGDGDGYDSPEAQQLAAGASEWRLLLQLDTDDDVNMMWGDCGLVYFWLRESDLQNNNFDQAWLVLQCF